jgi:hypothetical protein
MMIEDAIWMKIKTILMTIPSPKFVSVRKTPIYGGQASQKPPYMAVKKHNFKIGEGIELG